jgi:predicted lipid carrier protein YhbT
METHPHLQPAQLEQIFHNDIVSVTVGQTASCSLYRQDYESLLAKRWLRTGVLDLGLKLLVEQHKEEARKVFAMRGEFSEY